MAVGGLELVEADHRVVAVVHPLVAVVVNLLVVEVDCQPAAVVGRQLDEVVAVLLVLVGELQMVSAEALQQDVEVETPTAAVVDSCELPP
ncbi:hypothetical protein DYB38_005866 [Aphanomyces astaci]|uniref:Uncharacterized protein n=1 Tax=Aphanomyces astaci TaxID=112090 RepID=A0A397CEH3_APHAT|nr:hypothetical protein DYB38_005866 [Aphanomyces astaci]